MIICKQCLSENSIQANFCNHCGAPLQKSDKPREPKAKDHSSTIAERRQLTILFCDLVGSTSLSDIMDPEDYRQLILDYHQTAEKVIKGFGGHVAQYLGDGLLVYFGYPAGLEDAPRAAIRAGLDILAAMRKANLEWQKEGKPPANVRVGIHTGLVVVDDRLALGDTVNIAARLEGLAPENGLVISSQTQKLTEGWFEVKSIGKHHLKGIKEPMEVFQVLSQTQAKTKLDIAKSRGLSPLVGREYEFKRLEECWSSTKNGRGNVVFLRGEAGIGKSRLVDTLQDYIKRDSDSQLFEARCSSHHQNSAFYPLVELIKKEVLDLGNAQENNEHLSRLEAFVKDSGLPFSDTMSIFTELLSIPSKKFPSLVMSPIAKRQYVLESLTAALIGLSRNHPVLFVLEDLHWADASTLEWLSLFMPQTSTHPILSLCTARLEFHPEWDENTDIVQIDLKRLSQEQLAEICHHQTSGKALPQEILQQIALKTEGVPLFVEELTKMIMESDLLVEESDQLKLVDRPKMLAIPSTLQDSLLARLDKLADSKEIVQVGAVIGREFSYDMLDTVLDLEKNRLDQSLSRLLEADIIQTSPENKESSYLFKHALIQDAAYDSLLKSKRQLLHLKVAEAIEALKNGRAARPEVLAHHYTEANKDSKAIPLWLQAGQMANQKNANSEAISHLEMGISLLENIHDKQERNALELDFTLTLGGVYVTSYGFPHPKVKEKFDHARELAQNSEISPKLALILFNLLSYYMNTEEYASLRELTEYLISLKDHPQHGYWFDLAENQLCGGSLIKGDFKEARKGLERVLKIFDPSLPFPWELAPSGYAEIGAKAWLMVCLIIMGEVEEARKLADVHLSYAEDHKDSMTLYHIYTFPALYNLEAREWGSAESIINQYYPIARKFGDPVFILTADIYYHLARAFQGNKKAFEEVVKLVNFCFDIGFKAFGVSMTSWVAELYVIYGDYRGALSWIKKIIEHVNKTGSHIKTAELLRIQGLSQYSLGNYHEAEESYRQAIQTARKQSARIFELRAICQLAELLYKQGKLKEALDLLTSAIQCFPQNVRCVDLTQARNTLNSIVEDTFIS